MSNKRDQNYNPSEALEDLGRYTELPRPVLERQGTIGDAVRNIGKSIGIAEVIPQETIQEQTHDNVIYVDFNQRNQATEITPDKNVAPVPLEKTSESIESIQARLVEIFNEEAA